MTEVQTLYPMTLMMIIIGDEKAIKLRKFILLAIGRPRLLTPLIRILDGVRLCNSSRRRIRVQREKLAFVGESQGAVERNRRI